MAASTLRVEWVADTPSEPVYLLDRFRRLRDYADDRLDDVSMVSCAALHRVVTTQDGTNTYAQDFAVTDRTPESLVLRGQWAGTPGVVVRRGPGSRFVGPVFRADARADLERLARATDTRIVPHRGGEAVQLTDPSGFPVRVVYGIPELPAVPERRVVIDHIG